MGAFTNLLILFLVIIFSSLPLYFAVKLLGGQATILTVFLVNLGAAILISIVKLLVGNLGGVVGFILLLFIYHNVFRMGFIRSFFAWLLQFVIIAILIVVLGVLGISGLI